MTNTSELKKLLKSLAEETWDLLGLCREWNIRAYEDGITTSNLIRLNRQFKWTCIAVSDTRPKESQCGCDFELWIGTQGEWQWYAVQAKKISQDERYRAINHEVKGTKRLQIDILEEHARANRIKPIYCFYAYSEGDSCKEFGCSVAPAEDVKDMISKLKNPDFQSVKKISSPWDYLVSDSQPSDENHAPSLQSKTQDLPEYIRKLKASSQGESHKSVDRGEINNDSEYFPRCILILDTGSQNYECSEDISLE